MTLIEMLIVVAIIAILAVAGARTMQPALEGRRIREAARAVNVYLGVARNHALATGRPCGVLIRRFPNLPQCSMVLEQVEQPAPYAGSAIESVVKVADCTFDSGGLLYWSTRRVVLKVLVRDGDIYPRLIRRGDRMKINHQGPFYTVENDPSDDASQDYDFPVDDDGFICCTVGENGVTDTDGDRWIDSHVLTLTLDLSHQQTAPWAQQYPFDPNEIPTPFSNAWSTSSMPFKISRNPTMTKSAIGPLQLPAGTVIDLEASGVSNVYPSTFTHTAGGMSVTIMFSPNGSVDRYYVNNIDYRTTDPIFLMIGRRDNIPATPGEENWRDFTNLWITISPQTGLVTTAEVAAQDPSDGHTDDDFDDSRNFARQAQSMGGR